MNIELVEKLQDYADVFLRVGIATSPLLVIAYVLFTGEWYGWAALN